MIINSELKKLKTLLIDDNEFIRNSIEIAFRQKGYPLRTAATAEEGLQKLAVESFDIIISDDKLPGISGRTFLEYAGGTRADIIKILISACADHATIAAAYAGGIHDYLQKPFTLDTLWATMAMHAERRKRRAAVIDLRNQRRTLRVQGRAAGVKSQLRR